MSGRAGPNPRAIGLFVLGGIVLAVLGLIVFGGSRYFSHGDSFVIYFDELLKGLRRGAPVTFRGVDIGQVTEIRAIYEKDTGAVRVPVTVELRPGALTLTDGMAGGSDVLMDLAARGLRARLDVQSLLTGQLLIALDFFPPAGGAAATPPVPGEIPSVPSTLATLQRTVDSALMDAPEVTRSLKELVISLRDLLSGTNRESLQRSLVSLTTLADTLGDPAGPLQRSLADLPGLIADLRTGAAGVPALLARLDLLVAAGEKLIATGDARVKVIGEDVTKLAASVRKAVDQAAGLIADNRGEIHDFTEEGLPEIRGLVEDATRLVNELNGAIRDMRQDPARFFLGDRAGQGVKLP